MPASLLHLRINFQRIAEGDDVELRDLLGRAQRETEFKPNPEQAAWKRFLELADQTKAAARIPGSVGRRYASQYGMIAHRSPRGRKISIAMTTPIEAAVSRYLRESDQAHTEDGYFVYASRAAAKRTVEQMLKRCTSDIETTGEALREYRRGLKSLARKIDPDA